MKVDLDREDRVRKITLREVDNRTATHDSPVPGMIPGWALAKYVKPRPHTKKKES